MQKRYPFKFLDAYAREDKDFFFGRDEEIAALYEMVFQSDLILLYGASGTGKTSLIKCGLASKFQSHDWLALYIRRGTNINDSLQKTLKDAGGDLTDKENDLAWLEEDFASDDQVTSQGSNLSASLRAIYLQHFKPIYLIFDQFEELYILGNEAEQKAFIDSIKELLKVEQPVKIIISIREEYLGYLYEFEKAVPELLRKKLRVEPMNLDKIKLVVQKVGESSESNVRLKAGQEEKIGETIFEKIKGKEKKLSIPLPYLQVFLDKFYLKVTGDESRDSDAIFNLEALQQMEDLDDVLRGFLDDQVIAIAKAFNQPSEQLWRILSPFVTLEGTKDPLSVAEMQTRFPKLKPVLLANLLEAFQKRRILRYTENDELYEIAHDALAQQIHAKRDDDEIARLEVQRLIKSQMALKSESRAFLPEAQLKLVDLYKDKLSLKEEEKAYLQASQKEVERKEQEKKRRRNILLVVGLLAILVLSMITIWALQQRAEAEKQRIEATKQQEKAEQALQTIERNQKINKAEELMLYGDNYFDLGKIEEAQLTYQAALDSLGNVAGALKQKLIDKIERTK